MSNPEETNPRDELCRRFRSDLAQPESQRFYSEDDLIDIFDYAGDIADDYLRLEALLLGARLYPDSLELRERRAIFYLYLDQNAFKAFIDDNPSMDSPLWQILSLNLLRPGEPNAPKILQSFIDNAGELTDEEVIQFVQLAGSVGQTDWLLANLDSLRRHVTYLPTLLYEAAAQAEDIGRYEQAAGLVAELTDIEPYNADYWTMHATLNVMMGRQADAAADIDYALAIDPSNIEARRAKLGILTDDVHTAEFDALVDSILADSPDDADVALMALEQTSDPARMRAVLGKIKGHVKWTYALASKAAQAGFEGLEEVLGELADDGLTDPEEWKNIAGAAFDARRYPEVSTLIKVYRLRTGSELDCALYLYQMLYRSKSYDMVLQMYMASGDTMNLTEDGNSFKATAMFIMAMLRLGMEETAREFCVKLGDELDKIKSLPGDELGRFALSSFIADVASHLDAPAPHDWAGYDPLGLDA